MERFTAIKEVIKQRGKTPTVNPDNRSVYCGECGALVDPFEAIYDVAISCERLKRETENLAEVELTVEGGREQIDKAFDKAWERVKGEVRRQLGSSFDESETPF